LVFKRIYRINSRIRISKDFNQLKRVADVVVEGPTDVVESAAELAESGKKDISV
jgi:hypothetical protein